MSDPNIYQIVRLPDGDFELMIMENWQRPFPKRVMTSYDRQELVDYAKEHGQLID